MRLFSIALAALFAGCSGGMNTLPATSPASSFRQLAIAAKPDARSGCEVGYWLDNDTKGLTIPVSIADSTPAAAQSKKTSPKGSLTSSLSSITLSTAAPVATFTLTASRGPINVWSKHCPASIWSSATEPSYSTKNLTVRIGLASTAGACFLQYEAVRDGKPDPNTSAWLAVAYDLSAAPTLPAPTVPAPHGLTISPASVLITAATPQSPTIAISSSAYAGAVTAPQMFYYGLQPYGNQCSRLNPQIYFPQVPASEIIQPV